MPLKAFPLDLRGELKSQLLPYRLAFTDRVPGRFVGFGLGNDRSYRRSAGENGLGADGRAGRRTFDKTVSSKPLAFAAGAVLIYGYSMPFWYFSTIGEDADVWGEDFCGRWHALMLLRIGRAKQDCP